MFNLFKLISSSPYKNLIFLTSGLFIAGGSYLVFSKTDIVKNTVNFLNGTIVEPINNWILTPLEKGIKNVRLGIDSLFVSVKSWIGSIHSISVSNEGLIQTILKGGQKLVFNVVDLFKSFYYFFVNKLIPFFNSHTFAETWDYVKHYMYPIKHLFNRPELDRLQSIRSRWDQYVSAFSTPNFYSSLETMIRFYSEFKDQISLLTDLQMSELIDTYLDNPVEFAKKVNIVMDHLGRDASIKDKFNVNLVMDFIRGENVDIIKAKLASSKVSEEIGKAVGAITSFFSLGDETKSKQIQEDTQKHLEEKLGKVFSDITSWWNKLAG